VHSQDREKGLFLHVLPGSQEDGRLQAHFRSLHPESARCLQKVPHVTGLHQLLELVELGNWFTTIDLKDAYFHVEIAPKHRKYLCFAFQGIAYEYNRLPFGYSLSPRTFSKCVATALQPLRDRGMARDVIQDGASAARSALYL